MKFYSKPSACFFFHFECFTSNRFAFSDSLTIELYIGRVIRILKNQNQKKCFSNFKLKFISQVYWKVKDIAYFLCLSKTKMKLQRDYLRQRKMIDWGQLIKVKPDCSHSRELRLENVKPWQCFSNRLFLNLTLIKPFQYYNAARPGTWKCKCILVTTLAFNNFGVIAFLLALECLILAYFNNGTKKVWDCSNFKS